MKKAMLFMIALLFSVSASAATYDITQTSGTNYAVVGNGTDQVSASFAAGDATFDLTVNGPVTNNTLVNFDFIPEAGFLNGTMSIAGMNFDLTANFSTALALAAGLYEVVFDINYVAGSNAIQQFSVSEVPVPAAAFLFAPALLGLFGLRRKSQAVAA